MYAKGRLVEDRYGNAIEQEAGTIGGLVDTHDGRSNLANKLVRDRLRAMLNKLGFDTTDWVRVVMYRRCFEFIQTLGPDMLDVLEISAGPQWKRAFRFRSFTETHFPEFDVCSQTLERQYDLIIADQVFEHLPWPYRAGRNVFKMLRPGGTFIVATPFLLRVHKVPIDCSRWTEQGLSYLLQECGFPQDGIRTDSWGNRACLIANLKKWRRYGWYRSLANEPDYPLVVWAFARKPDGHSGDDTLGATLATVQSQADGSQGNDQLRT
jgi:SAM-dependent methyltransferase